MLLHYIRRFFYLSFFAPLGTLGLILVRHYLKECGNAAMPQFGKNTEHHCSPTPCSSFQLQLFKDKRDGKFVKTRTLNNVLSPKMYSAAGSQPFFIRVLSTSWPASTWSVKKPSRIRTPMWSELVRAAFLPLAWGVAATRNGKQMTSMSLHVATWGVL